METHPTWKDLQQLLTLLDLTVTPEGKVLDHVLSNLLSGDPFGFHTQVPRGFTAEQCYLVLLHSALLQTSLGAAAHYLYSLGLHVPAGEAVLKRLRTRTLEELVQQMDALFYQQWLTLPEVARAYLASQLVLSLDSVRHPYYGDREKANVVGGRRKASSSYNYTYGSAKLLWEGHGLTIAVRMLRKGQARAAWVRELLHQAERYGRLTVLLGDGDFWVNELLWEWAQQRRGFVIHVGGGLSKSKITKQLQEQARKTKKVQTTRYTIHLQHPARQVSVRLIAWADAEGEPHCIGVPAFLDELPPGWFIRLYRSRFGIETGYRLWNELKPRTISRDPRIRYTLVATAICLYNAYSLIRTSDQLSDAPQSREWRRLLTLVHGQAAKKRRRKRAPPAQAPPKETCTTGPLTQKFRRPTFYLTIKQLKMVWFKVITMLGLALQKLLRLPCPQERGLHVA